VKVVVGPVEQVRNAGCTVVKAGSHGVCVVWHDGRFYAVDDRCPHMGFPLHRGSVDHGLLTCHWHHARFDLATGGTLDPFADDVRAYQVEIDDGTVSVVVEPEPDRREHLQSRLRDGMEQGLTLVTAKSVLGLMDSGPDPAGIVRTGIAFGTTYRREGWGAGLTVLVAMANLLPHLDPPDRSLALVHGLAFVSRDTRNHAPRFALAPLTGDIPGPRLPAWYRRFVDTRSTDAAERTLLTAIAGGSTREDIARMMTAAATDHIFLDGGHTLDFHNKAFEALDHIGWAAAAHVLPTLVPQTARADRAEDHGEWRHPHDLVALAASFEHDVADLVAKGRDAPAWSDGQVGNLGRTLLADDPIEVIDALRDAVAGGASPEQLGRAVAFAAALRLVRFHVQNDHGDWDVVHHGFTAANALHQSLVRAPSAELLRATAHCAIKVYLDRFLNVPAARLPEGGATTLDELDACWDVQGAVDHAGAIVYGYLRSGGDPARAVAKLGQALLAEDAEFHWFQTLEAAVRQFHAWPAGSEEGALVLTGAARFLAAHTPTRRELPQVVRIASRLRRGEQVFEDEDRLS
jgi:nitrite reductase/ring-hydroxylating ferredoxin subunit